MQRVGWNRTIVATLLLLFHFHAVTGVTQAADQLANLEGSRPSTKLEQCVRKALELKWGNPAQTPLLTNQAAVTLVELNSNGTCDWGSYRGDSQIYPASVVKLFYLVAVHHWLEQKKLPDTDELRRAMKDMIVDSSNEATHYIVDLLTGTTSGPELTPSELAAWHENRNAVNRYFEGLQYLHINVNKKPWCEGPYGRETQAIQAFVPKRNLLTTDATARLLVEIAMGHAVSSGRSQQMLELLSRDLSNAQNPEGQILGFIGSGVPPNSKVWSKAGWTSQTRHDAAYIERSSGRKFILVVFTENHAADTALIPGITRAVFEQVEK